MHPQAATPTPVALVVTHLSVALLALLGVALLVVAALVVRIVLMRRRERRVVADLQQSTVQVAAVFETALDAIVAMDQEGVITQWNPAAEELLGWTSAEAIGRTVADTIVPERYRGEHRRGLARFVETGVAPLLERVVEMAALRRDGTEIPVDLSVNLAYQDDEERTIFVAFIRDVRARQHAEMVQGVRFVAASVLGDATSLPETIDRILQVVGSRLSFAVVSMWMPGSGGLRCQQVWAADSAGMAALIDANHRTVLPPSAGIPGRVWSQMRPVTLAELPSAREDSSRMAVAGGLGMRDVIGVPVTVAGRVLGVVEAFATEERGSDEELVRTLSDLGVQLGQFVARRRAETQHESPEHVAALLETAADPMVVVAEDGMIVGINSRARQLLGYGSLDVTGVDLRLLLNERDREPLLDYVRECLRQQAGDGVARRWCDVEARRRDGSPIELGLHLTPVAVSGRNLFIGLVTTAPPELGAIPGAPLGRLRVHPGGTEQQPRLA